MFERRCEICGKPFPEGTVASRRFCLDCGVQHKREKEAEQRIRRRNLAIELKKTESAAEQRPKCPPKTLLEKDKKYCAKCIYRGRYTAGYLCNYLCMTGERRGCPPGVGCNKKTLASQREPKYRTCVQCGERITDSKYAKFCAACRLEIRRESAIHINKMKLERKGGSEE